MPLRRRLYRQLATQAWRGAGCSPLNRVVIGLILANLILQVLETEPSLYDPGKAWFDALDWVFNLAFSVEYLARLWVMGEDPRYRGPLGRLRYALTPFALIDLLALAPLFLSSGAVNASGLRTLRLLRVLRFAQFGAFSAALAMITDVFRARVYELTVSAMLVLGMLLVSATLMFLAEGTAQPDQFGSIPRALWWAVVTMTTVGYGDAFPVTPLGKVLAGFVQLLSIAMVAIPTGIMAASFVEAIEQRKARRRNGGSAGQDAEDE